MGLSIWSRMIGCRRPLARLEEGIAGGRPAHAYLFCGPAGVGKRTAALGLAQRLNCRAAKAPCGECLSCRQIEQGAHPELRCIEPEEQGEGGRSLVHKIDVIREIQAESHLRPFGDAVRLYLMNAADRMTEPAANCLLKTLEEPPDQVVLVLCSEEPAALLPTLHSRLRRIDFVPAPRAEVAEWLRREHGLEPGAADLWAGVAAGRPGRALALATGPGVQEFRAGLYERLQRSGGTPPVAALAAAEAVRSGLGEGREGTAIELALEMLEWWYRDALVWRVTGREERLVCRDALAGVRRFAEGSGAEELRSALTALHEARLAWRRNANAGLLLEVLWLRLSGARRG